MLNKIDYTNLSPTVTRDTVKKMVGNCKKYGFRGICIPPTSLVHIGDSFTNTDFITSTVIGYPLGYNSTSSKIEDIYSISDFDVDEVDIVWNHGLFAEKKYLSLLKELSTIVDIATNRGLDTKIIVEEGFWNDNDLMLAESIVLDSGAAYIKTSSGYYAPARLSTVKMWHRIKVKAAGGIRTAKDLRKFVEAGASVIGTSSGVAIAEELRNA
ncbi:MAG: deoxyribose-phosphate aldolase [Clostridia bacterium]|jgi:deoxyribose-phosphate aldolase